MDKHLPGRVQRRPASDYACPSWYGELGHFLTTKFFGMKINKYMHDHGISPTTLARVAAKNYRNGALNPNAFRRKPLSEEEILGSRMLNYPLTQYMFCSPDEGAAAVVLCRADRAHRYTDDADLPARHDACGRGGSARSRCTARGSRSRRTAGPTVDASRAAFEMAGIGPEDVDVIQLQDTDAGAEVIHLAENGFCADGEQEELVADGATEIGGRLPVNTDGGLIANGEPIGASGLRQVHEIVLQLRGQAGDRQVPGEPEGRLHPALRRARHRGRVDPDDVMATYVLVHGGAHGGWCYGGWRRRLRAAGHEVYAPTLTGLGERAHLLSPAIDLDTPHPRRRGGAPLRGPARRDPGRPQLRRHGDHRRRRPRAGPHRPPRLPRRGDPGERPVAAPTSPRPLMAARPQPGQVVDGVELVLFPGTEPLPHYGVTDPDDIAWMDDRLTPHPWRCFEQPLVLADEAAVCGDPADAHRLHVDARQPGPEPAWPRPAEGRVWDIDTGHDLMITEPAAVAELLLRVAVS